MMFLWIFGNNVEDSMGPVKFFAFYILGGIAALALQVAIAPNSTTPTSAPQARSPPSSAATSCCIRGHGC